MMKVFCLRSIFDSSGVWLKNEEEIVMQMAQVRFSKTVTLPLTSIDTVGKAEDGKLAVQAQTVNKTYTGTPFLIEIDAIENAEETVNLSELRARLEARTESIASLLDFASPRIIGSFITSALFNRKESYEPNMWDWEDVVSFRPPLYHEDLVMLKDQLQDIDSILSKLAPEKKEAISMAIRWLHRATQLETLVDRFIAYWIILEIVSGHMSHESSIRLRIKEALKKLYPNLSESGRCESLCDVLYRARSKSLHGGYRDLTNIHLLEGVANNISEASIKYLLYRTLPVSLSDDILKMIGVVGTK